jgi:hypothetical protein
VVPIVQLSSRGLRNAPVKNTGHVHDDGADEDVAGPVVHLAHQQSAAHGEGEVDRRGVGLGHLLSVEGQVAAVVGDVWPTRHEVQRQEDAGDEQDDEGVQGDLAQHERPVVGEDLVHERAPALGDAQAVVQLVEGLADAAVGPEGLLLRSLGVDDVAHERSQNPGPTASW